VNKKGYAPCAKLLDKQVTKEVVVPREVRHVHELGEPPRGGGRGIVSAPVFGHLDCPRGRRGLAYLTGWWWYGTGLWWTGCMIAPRTRTLTDDALLGHAPSHGHRMHMGQGRNGNSSRYVHQVSPVVIPRRRQSLTLRTQDDYSGSESECGGAESYALICSLDVQHTAHGNVFSTKHRTK
jgi:hypothetical protein